MVVQAPGCSVEWENPFDISQTVFTDCWQQPFVIEGCCEQGLKEKRFLRLPDEVGAQINPTANQLRECSAGICIRFMTDSPYVAVDADVPPADFRHHFSPRGAGGLDIYAGPAGRHEYRQSASPMELNSTRAQGVAQSAVGPALQPWTIYLPNYTACHAVRIGVQEGSQLLPPLPHTYSAPVAFYGSSITQGGCASRVGLCYTHVVTRWLDCGLINLGFSGSAKGEQAIAEYIAGLKLSAFVLDYDHNATIGHLKETHWPFFETIRRAQPNLPILMMPKCDYEEDNLIDASIKRRSIIYGTYLRARSQGDQHVGFVDGYALFGDTDRDACTVDGCHPNDLGFMRMAQAVRPVLQELLFSQV